jgi:hypothetical protein
MAMFLVVAYLYSFEVAVATYWLPVLFHRAEIERRGNQLFITQDFNRPLPPLAPSHSGMLSVEVMHMEYVFERCIQDLKRRVARHAAHAPM